jgi:hypothetical protein
VRPKGRNVPKAGLLPLVLEQAHVAVNLNAGRWEAYAIASELMAAQDAFAEAEAFLSAHSTHRDHFVQTIVIGAKRRETSVLSISLRE